MKFTYDAKVDMGYIVLVDDRSKGIVNSYPILDENGGPHIIVDIYPDGIIHGIEVVSAKAQLGVEFIRQEAPGSIVGG